MIPNSHPRVCPSSNFAFALQCRFGRQPRDVYRMFSPGSGYFWRYTPGSGKGNPGMLRIFTPQEVASAFRLGSPGPTEARPLAEIIGADSVYHAYLMIRDRLERSGQPATPRVIEEKTSISEPRQCDFRARADAEHGDALVLRDVYESMAAAVKRLKSTWGAVGNRSAQKRAVFLLSGIGGIPYILRHLRGLRPLRDGKRCTPAVASSADRDLGWEDRACHTQRSS